MFGLEGNYLDVSFWIVIILLVGFKVGQWIGLINKDSDKDSDEPKTGGQ